MTTVRVRPQQMRQRGEDRFLRDVWNGIRLVSSALVALYAIALLLHSASLYLVMERPVWLAVVDTFALGLYLPLPLVVILALVARTWVALGALALSAMLFFTAYGYRFLPREAPVPPAAVPLRVLSNNVLVTNQDTEQLLAVIREEDPDVVVLQELSRGMASDLARDLAREYPHQALNAGWTDGLGVFSRHPIQSSRLQPLAGEATPAQVISLDVGGRRVTLVNVHLPSPDVDWRRSRRLPFVIPSRYDATARDRELAALLREVEGMSGPVVVAGDFNLPERSPGYVQLSRRLHDAYAAAGDGLGHTFPQLIHTFDSPGILIRGARHLGPFLRIDYIWHNGQIATLETRVAAPTGSDHRPVVARLAILGQGRHQQDGR